MGRGVRREKGRREEREMRSVEEWRGEEKTGEKGEEGRGEGERWT